MPIELDWTYVFFLGLTLVFMTAIFLFVRKVLVSFREGIEEGRR